MNPAAMNKPLMQADVPAHTAPAPGKSRPSDWDEIGEAFETMGKIGLAMTVGFTAAALFCRWADQKKLKASSVKQVIDQLS